MSVTLTIRTPPLRMPAWYPPQDPAAPHVYELSEAAFALVQRVLQQPGIRRATRFDGSTESCGAIARALRELSGDGGTDATLLEEMRSESMRNDLFHFGAFNAVAADCGGYTIHGAMIDALAALPSDLGEIRDLPRPDAEEDEEDDDDSVAIFEDWAELQAWAAESYEVEDEGGGIFSFVVDWTDTDRTQRVIVRHAMVQDESCAVFVSFVARKEQVDPWLLLSRNLEDAFATFGVDDEGRILLTCTFPLAVLTPGRFDALVDVLAARADDAEHEFTDDDEF